MIAYENLKKVNEPLFDLYQQSFTEFLQSGWYILGKNVENFERQFANYCQTNYCVGVASGLDALSLAIAAFDFPKGAEIIVPSNTYIATILAIVNNGLIPILVEPNIATYNIDVNKIEAHITPKTVAIMAVHLYGKISDMKAIMSIANRHQLMVFEDVAQAHGAMQDGKKAGSFGVGCFSFYPTKNLGALADAGSVNCQDEALALKIRALRNYGSIQKYHNEYQGINSRLDEVQAGFLSIKLNVLDKINSHKRALADIYNQCLDDRFIKPIVQEGYHDVYHIYNVRVDDRNGLKQYLAENQIGSEVHYPVPPYRQKCMQGILKGDYPLSDIIHQTTLSLPISYSHSKDDIYHVCEVVNRWIQKNG